jgi:hypothetical protein
MKNRRHFPAIVFIVSAFLATLLTSHAVAQTPDKTKIIELTSTRVEKGNAKKTDANIKHGEMANNPSAKRGAPPTKGGVRSAGGCRVQFDNSTDLYIKVYVDGSFRGTMGPWDDSYVYVLPGITRVYARADYTDGSFRYWGPKEYDCGNDEYINFRMVL